MIARDNCGHGRNPIRKHKIAPQTVRHGSNRVRRIDRSRARHCRTMGKRRFEATHRLATEARQARGMLSRRIGHQAAGR